MKKKFTLHLDALIVIIALFVASLGLNAFLYSQFTELTQENQELQWKELENSLNLSSQEGYINKLKKQLDEIKAD